MSEDFLHYVWKFGLFNVSDLNVETGEPIEIIHKGMHNSDSGPDFQNSVIKIGGTTWAGNVEIHVNASDWIKHNHSCDKAYDNVILHVVFNHDTEIKRSSGEVIPALELSRRIYENIYNNYLELLRNKKVIPCGYDIKSVDDTIKTHWLERMLIERLLRKSDEILNQIELTNGNWSEIFYRKLAWNFGFKINADPFELLSKSLPYSILAKHADQLLQLEALLFGQAGMLNEDFTQEYPLKLKKEYNVLKSKYNLSPIEKHRWKFLRLRPVNFPTIRIAQFAALMKNSEHLFSKILQEDNIENINSFFQSDVSSYWQNHFVFEKSSSSSAKKLGKPSVENILINTVAPIVFAYGRYNNSENLKEKAITLLDKIPFEKNNITNLWNEVGFSAANAAHSQALIELKNNYCNFKRCLACAIGNKILRKN
jgi:hypothetical protein